MAILRQARVPGNTTRLKQATNQLAPAPGYKKPIPEYPFTEKDRLTTTNVPNANVYGTNKDAMTDNQLNLLAGKGNSKNTFSPQANESIWNSWAENGRPLVNQFAGDKAKTGRAYFHNYADYNYFKGPRYKYWMERIKNPTKGANVMTIRPGDVGDYFAELSHANQLKRGKLKYNEISPDRQKYSNPIEYDRRAYSDPTTIEYDAHQRIEPQLYKKYPMPDSSAEEDLKVTINSINKDERDRRLSNTMNDQFVMMKLGIPVVTEVYKGRTPKPVSRQVYGTGVYESPRETRPTQPVKPKVTIPMRLRNY